MKPNDLKELASGARELARDAAAAVTAAAEAQGLVDVAIGEVDSPVGPLTVAVTPRGLARVAFADEDRDEVMAELARDLSPRILGSASRTDEVRRQLEEFFSARRTRFEVPIDRRLIGGIAREVLRATSRIPYGELSTYGTIAKRIGRPTASRAVGRALGSNPIPIVIPCHRVVGASGALTGYAGGLDRKITLLRLEGSLLPG
jgi:methylated-DNA-[protein]-cysteine S-methyltransferase